MKELEMYRRGAAKTLIPLVSESIHVGFESPAADYEEEQIDLNDYLSKYPEATFFARVVGECMIGSGIYPEDPAGGRQITDPCQRRCCGGDTEQ